MANPIIDYFRQYLDLTSEEEDYLLENVPIIDLEADHFLLREGEVSESFYFVIDGIIRMYYLVDGIEKTTFFYQKNDFVSSYESFTQQVPSKHFVQTVAKTKVAEFRQPVVFEIIAKLPRFDMLSRVIMEQELIVYQDMLASFITMDAEQRYCHLLHHQPQLFQLIPQYHIATYLGVSPETLSRIKSRIREKGLLDDRQ